MLHVVNTIGAIFAIILLGKLLQARDFLGASLLGSLNRLVYYLAIPAMIFHAVATAPFEKSFSLLLLAGTLCPVLAVFALAFQVARMACVKAGHAGTFVQSSIHGNLGYIGLAVAFYLLGEEGLSRAGILAGFLMLFQNVLAVAGLQAFSGSGENGPRLKAAAGKVVANPVIGSALAGILFSMAGLGLPEVLDRALAIISGMALPLALLIIGASISFGLIKSHLRPVLAAGLLKLCVLPALGLLAYRLLGLPKDIFLPGLILLAAPTATITYVMAGEMQGSTDLASAAVSMNTLLSAVSYIFWLSWLL